MSEKWWDMSDDELDDLFREASDKAEIPFDSSALDKLRQKMDFKPTPKPETSKSFRKRWIALAGFLIFFGVALLYNFSGKKENLKQDDNSAILPAKTLSSKIVGKKILKMAKLSTNVDENNAVRTGESKSNSIDSQITKNEISQNRNSRLLANSIDKKSYGQIDTKSGTPTYFSNKKLLNQEIANGTSKDNLLKNKSLEISNNKSTDERTSNVISELNDNSSVIKKENIESKVNFATISYSSKKNSKQSKSKKLKINNSQVDNPSIYSETNSSILTPNIILENKLFETERLVKTNFFNVDLLANKTVKSLKTNIESESPKYVDTPPIVTKVPKFSRFGIRLAIAPEISSIEKMETSAVVGSLYGLLLEYRLTKKLTLQTGVSYSKKKYTGNFDYYYAWTGASPKPVNIDGVCKVIDIPINLRFNAFQMNRNTFFISGGVSSYLMSDEIYTYNYAWGPPKVRDWTGDSSSFYWSTLNLSAGIERKMNKNFTLQVEPFLKMPLVGVGRGGVNLYSSGLLFSTKYEF